MTDSERIAQLSNRISKLENTLTSKDKEIAQLKKQVSKSLEQDDITKFLDFVLKSDLFKKLGLGLEDVYSNSKMMETLLLVYKMHTPWQMGHIRER